MCSGFFLRVVQCLFYLRCFAAHIPAVAPEQGTFVSPKVPKNMGSSELRLCASLHKDRCEACKIQRCATQPSRLRATGFEHCSLISEFRCASHSRSSRPFTRLPWRENQIQIFSSKEAAQICDFPSQRKFDIDLSPVILAEICGRYSGSAPGMARLGEILWRDERSNRRVIAVAN